MCLKACLGQIIDRIGVRIGVACGSFWWHFHEQVARICRSKEAPTAKGPHDKKALSVSGHFWAFRGETKGTVHIKETTTRTARYSGAQASGPKPERANYHDCKCMSTSNSNSVAVALPPSGCTKADCRANNGPSPVHERNRLYHLLLFAGTNQKDRPSKGVSAHTSMIGQILDNTVIQ